MAKRKHRRIRRFFRAVRSKPRPTIPISVVAPLGASFFVEPKPGWNTPFYWAKAVASGQTQYGDNLMRCLLNGWLFLGTGGGNYNFDINGGQYTKMMIIGLAVHWIAGKLGINRALGRTKIPFIRI